MDTDAAWELKVRLLRERLEVELAEVEAFVEAEATRQFTGVLGRMFTGVAKALLHWLGRDEIRRKLRAQVGLVCRLAAEGGPGDAERVFQAHRERLFNLDEVYHRSNHKHAAWRDVEPLLAELIRQRFLALHRYLHAPAGATTFEGAARAAYPERRDLAAVLAEQMRLSWEITRRVERDPAVVRVPGFLEKPLIRIVTATMQWYERRIETFLNDVYGPPPPA